MAELIRTACPGCGRVVGLRPQQVGKRVRCGGCGERFVAAETATSPAGGVSDTAVSPPPPPPPPPPADPPLDEAVPRLLAERWAALAAVTEPVKVARQVFAILEREQVAAAPPSGTHAGAELGRLHDAARQAAREFRQAGEESDALDGRVRRLRRERATLWGKFRDWFVGEILGGTTNLERLEKAEEQREEAEERRGLAAEALASVGGQTYAALQRVCLDAASAANVVTDRLLGIAGRADPAGAAGWADPRWTDWPPAGPNGVRRHVPTVPRSLRVGELAEDTARVLAGLADGEPRRWLAAAVRPVRVPALVPFVGAGRALVVEAGGGAERAAGDLLQAVVLRVLALLGRQVKFTLLDPSGLGQAFPMQRFLPACRNPARDAAADLTEVLDDIRRINREVLLDQDGLHDLDAKLRDREPFELVVAANFPKGFDRRAVEALFAACEVGPRAGRYVVVHHNPDVPLPRDMSWDAVPNRYVIRPGSDPNAPWAALVLDAPPPAREWGPLADKIKASVQDRAATGWDEVVGVPEAEWWTASAADQVTTPIGLRGASDRAEVWFGVNTQKQPCSHGVLAGQTGMGKSNLYHTLILGLAVRYPPDELRLYLVDGKFGTEFQPYAALPHAAVVSLNSPPELARSVVEELYREMERRNERFRAAGVSDFAAYRAAGGDKLPRLLLLVDEYQLLFEDDPAGQASDLVRRLSQQGRSAGIHMLLGKQTFGAPGMLFQRETFANFQLRLSLKLNAEDVLALTEFGPNGKRLLRECDGPGKFVLNATGRDDDCVPGVVALLKKDRLPDLLGRLSRKAPPGLRPVVFRGDRPPDLLDNAALAPVRRGRAWADDRGREAFARREEADPAGGLGLPGWVAADRPVALWAGRRVSVHGHATVLLRRGPGENLAVLAAAADVRAGVLAGGLVAAAALYRPAELTVRVIAPADDPDDPVLAAARAAVRLLLAPLGFAAAVEPDPAAAVDALAAEVEARAATGGRGAASVLAVVLDPERVAALRRAGDGPAARAAKGDAFRRVLADGPACGIHTAVLTGGLRTLAQVIAERQDLPLFGHRVATQTGEDESFTLFRNRKAAQLQADASPVPTALYFNVQANQAVRFKPYAALAGDGWEAAGRLAADLAGRRPTV